MLSKHVRIKDGIALKRARLHGRCQYCKRGGIIHPHHIKHMGGGGDDTAENLISLCVECHGRAHAGFITKDELLQARGGEFAGRPW